MKQSHLLFSKRTVRGGPPGIMVVAALVLAWSLSGCASVKIPVSLTSPPPNEATGVLRAGAGRVDLTPPPGYPMGGFSLAGRYARGWWTRLYARAIYLEAPDGTPLVLLSCDLWEMPAGLADKVAERLSEGPIRVGDARIRLGREHLIIAATHTHHSPGNYSSGAGYNMLASAGVGFDQRLFDFLVDRMAHAVVLAVASRREATVTLATDTLTGLTRNRSMEAFRRNPPEERQAFLAQWPPPDRADVKGRPAGVTPEAVRAVDPVLTVIEAATPEDEPIAVAAFFATHPTAMGPRTEVYGSDVFGVAAHRVERYLATRYGTTRPVAAFFNGTEGDVMTNWKVQDRANTVRLGEGIARGVLRALNGQGSPPAPVGTTLTYRYRRESLPDQPATMPPGADLCEEGSYRTDSHAVPGVASLGGAENGRSFLYDLGFREGVRRKTCKGLQGVKYSAVDFLGDEIPLQPLTGVVKGLIHRATSQGAPRAMPMGLYTIGNVTLATLPAEVTVMNGYRYRKTLQKEIGPAQKILFVGLANAYLSYIATPEEYQAQHYEGASTLYGQASATVMGEHVAGLSGTAPNTADYDRKVTYHAGRPVVAHFGRIGEAEVWHPEEGLATVLEGYAHPVYAFDWTAPIVALERGRGHAARSVNPTVTVEAWAGLRWAVLTYPKPAPGGADPYVEVAADGESTDFATVILRTEAGNAFWRAYWLAPSPGLLSGRRLRFRITTPEGVLHCSEAFLTSGGPGAPHLLSPAPCE